MCSTDTASVRTCYVDQHAHQGQHRASSSSVSAPDRLSYYYYCQAVRRRTTATRKPSLPRQTRLHPWLGWRRDSYLWAFPTAREKKIARGSDGQGTAPTPHVLLFRLELGRAVIQHPPPTPRVRLLEPEVLTCRGRFRLAVPVWCLSFVSYFGVPRCCCVCITGSPGAVNSVSCPQPIYFHQALQIHARKVEQHRTNFQSTRR